MSMGKKIFMIAALLGCISVVILVLGWHSLEKMTDTAANLAGLARRAINFNTMNDLTLRRKITIDKVISARTAEEKVAPRDRLAELNRNMAAELEELVANIPDDAIEDLKNAPKMTAALWDDYVTTTDRAVQLGIENSNNEAAMLHESTLDFWKELDNEITLIADRLRLDDDPEISRWSPSVRGARADLAFMLNAIQQTLSTYDQERIDTAKAEAEANAAAALDLFRELARDVPAGSGGRALAAILAKLESPGMEQIAAVLDLSSKNTNGRALVLNNTEGYEAEWRLFNSNNALIQRSADTIAAATADAAADSRNTVVFMLTIGGIGIAAGMIIAVMTINRTTSGLNRIIVGLGESSGQVNTAASQIKMSSESLAEGATQQAASLEETSSALEQMASMTRQNADNAGKTNESTAQVTALVTSGAVAVENMSKAMHQIDESAEQIQLIIKTIEDIAFQTNLLALNAAVEAARAGDAGKGFAVVADEVRNLAQRSAQAARDTTHLIETTIERVRNGSELATELDASFKEIREGSTGVAALISEIAAATNEQASGVDQVNTAVAQMDKVTQQNAASAEESASASEELSSQAEALDGMVANLTLMVEGKNGNGREKNESGKPKPGREAGVKSFGRFMRSPMRSLPAPTR